MKLHATVRFLCRALLLLSASAAVAWWAWLLPIARGSVPAWARQYSAQGFWDAKQEALKRGFWMHDDGWIVGMFGDKEWAGRIVGKMAEGKEFHGCANGHQESALECLTNHDAAAGAESEAEIAKAWVDWWQQNSMKTQEEWIQQGFSQAGIKVSLPSTREDWQPLLRIVGAAAGPGWRVSAKPNPLHPEHLRYNAYRWLRDSGFDPMRFVLENDMALLDGDVRGGLMDYGTFEKETRMSLATGRMSFANMTDDGPYAGLQLRVPGLASPRFQDAVGASLCGTMLSAALVLLFTRSKAASVPVKVDASA